MKLKAAVIVDKFRLELLPVKNVIKNLSSRTRRLSFVYKVISIV